MPESAANSPRIRNARACENCRTFKSRCVYKSEPGICQRCELSGSQCIVRTKARPMRARKAQSSTAASKSAGCSNNEEFRIDLPAIPPPETAEDLGALRQHHEGVFDEEDSLTAQSFDSPGSSQTIENSVTLEKRRISLVEAEALLSSYRQKAPYFPFVRIPQNATVTSLSKTSPFLLLAIFTSASISEPRLYHQLDYQFKCVLSSRVIVEGKKSLDFLQGLLIYIAWYPFHINPKANQAFMHMNLAISLAIDLGLDEEIPNSSKLKTYDCAGLVGNGMFTDAARRAYLGCYYLSSALSMGYQKPNNLPHRSLMNTHGELLMSDDNLIDIYSMIRLQRLLERISEADDSKKPICDHHMIGFDPEVKIQLFQNELQEWHNSTPDHIKNLPSVGIIERFVRVSHYSHELGLLRWPYRDYIRSMSNQGVAKTSHLFSCLEASKIFFEYLLSVPQSDYVYFTAVQWGAVVEAILVLSRLTFLMATNLGWDAETARCNVPLLMYLDALCYRFQSLSTTTSASSTSASGPNSVPQNPDVLYVFKLVLGSVKRSYEQRVAKIQPPTLVVNQGNGIGPVWTGHCPMLDPSLSVYFQNPDFVPVGVGSFDTSGAGAGAGAGVTEEGDPDGLNYHDLWATMTGNWAKDY